LSYDIIYGKQVVKLRRTGEVIIMLLAGSNNCYEVGQGGRSGRRVRDWEAHRFYNRKGKFSEKPEVILNNLDAELRRIIRRHKGDGEAKPADIRNRFGYYSAIVVGSGHCGGTSWDKYRGLYANGIKRAITIEELDQLGVNLRFHPGYKSPNGYPDSMPLKTERDYFTEIKKWREWKDGDNSTEMIAGMEFSRRSFYLSFLPSDTDTVSRRLRAPNRKEPREKTRVVQDYFFVLASGSYSLLKYTRRGYRYSFRKSGGKKFRTEKEAETYRKKIVTKKLHQADIWKVERIEEPCGFMV